MRPSVRVGLVKHENVFSGLKVNSKRHQGPQTKFHATGGGQGGTRALFHEWDLIIPSNRGINIAKGKAFCSLNQNLLVM